MIASCQRSRARRIRLLAVVVAVITASCGRLGFDERVVPGDGGGPSDSAVPTPDAALNCVGEPRVQSGEVDLADGPAVVVPISPIDPSCSFVLCEQRTTSSSPMSRALCDLRGPDELQIEAGQAAFGTVRWQVISASTFRVIRGVRDIAAIDAAASLPIAEVAPDRSFALLSSYANTTGIDNDERAVFSIELDDAQTVIVRRGESGVTARLAWQVIELSDGRVQQGRIDLASMQLVGQATTAPVALGRSFVLSSVEADADTDGEEAAWRVRAALLDPTTIEVSRRAAEDALAISYFLVELPPPARTETVTTTTVAPHDDLTIRATLTGRPVNAFAISSSTIDSGVQRAVLGASSVTTAIDSDGFELERLAEAGVELTTTTFVVSLGL